MSIEIFFGNVSYALHVGRKTPCWEQSNLVSLTKIYYDDLGEVSFAKSIFLL
jgi:hypothetical protein